MWKSIVFNIIVSIILIFIFHSLWNYLKNTYSTKKTKNIVENQVQKYKSIIEEMQQIPDFQSSPSENITMDKLLEKDLELFLGESL